MLLGLISAAKEREIEIGLRNLQMPLALFSKGIFCPPLPGSSGAKVRVLIEFRQCVRKNSDCMQRLLLAFYHLQQEVLHAPSYNNSENIK